MLGSSSGRFVILKFLFGAPSLVILAVVVNVLSAVEFSEMGILANFSSIATFRIVMYPLLPS
jgi:hypothetical protein